MNKFYTSDNKEITLAFLTKAKAGQEFVDSKEGNAFFGSSDGFDFFMSSVGKDWIKTEKGFDKLKGNILNFTENPNVQKMFCTDDGQMGYNILVSPSTNSKFSVGEALVNSKNIQLLVSLGNQFFQSDGGRKFLFGTHSGTKFMESREAREWIIKEGDWIFEFWHPASEEIFDWILETPINIQKKFFSQSYIEQLFIFDFGKWFLNHGEKLFSQKILGDSFKTYQEYRNHLLNVLNNSFTENEKEIFELANKNEFNDESMIWVVEDFILGSGFTDFWLSFDSNKEKFKNYFCMNDGKIGYSFLKKNQEKEEKRKDFCKDEFWRSIENHRKSNPVKNGWDHANWDHKLEEDFVGEKEWIKTKAGKEMMLFMGNSFLQTTFGKKWLFDWSNQYIYSQEGKVWLLKEGEWAFGSLEENQHMYFILGNITTDSYSKNTTTYTFLNWVLTTPENFQKKYWNSSHSEHLICEGGNLWFEKNGQSLFEKGHFTSKTKKFCGNEVEVLYNSFKEFQNELAKRECSLVWLFSF
jgi:hypothetical protein